MPWTVRIYRGVFSFPVIVTALSASTARVVRTVLLPLVTSDWSSEASAGALSRADILSLLVALPVGFVLAAELQWLRRRAIGRLLTYTGWVFEQSSLATKAWGILLKLLVGPGPHRLYEFEDVLPRLPLPSLQQTCTKYLETVKPLLSADDYEQTEQLVRSLLVNEGPILQKHLQTRRDTLPSWLSDWWLSSAYLSRREPIAVNVNFFMMSTVRPQVSTNYMARAAQCLNNVTRYYEMIRDETLPPDMIMDLVPLCMDSVRYMLGSCRVPGLDTDTLTVASHSRHVVVVRKGIYFRLDVYTTATDGRTLRRCSKQELKDQLLYIVEQTEDEKPMSGVAALTSASRTDWAKNRQQLLQSSVNAATLQEIETALFVLVLGQNAPQGEDEQAKMGLTGDGSSLWFDKCLTIGMFEDTTMSVANMEHAGADATHFAVMWDHILQLEEFDSDGDLVLDDSPSHVATTASPQLPRRLEWELTSEMENTIHQCLENYQNVIADVDLVVYHTKFGKKWMKKQRISPDGFLQMAIQLAYWRLHGEFTKTYEPASHRLFALGRTENVNPVTERSVRWVRAMVDDSFDRQARVGLLRDAVDRQNRLRLDATVGLGSERHLLGLARASAELGVDLPPVFTDKAYQLPMKLSTSQVPTNIGHRGLSLVPESCLGGFGPVCQDGYGLLYCSIGDDMFNFNITSWKSCIKTDSRRLANEIDTAMDIMKRLFATE